MQKRRLWRYSKLMLVLASIIIAIGGASTAMAITSSSSHYQVTETQFNAGTTQKSCSVQYCAQVSIGEATDGKKVATTNATFDTATDNEPLLEVIVEAGASNLGVLTTESTATKITTVRIRNYLSGGYILQVTGDPPKFNGHTLNTSSTPVPAVAGTEQFGINAAVNTIPNVGVAPIQVPADQRVFGVVNALYNTPNRFKYTSGDTIARSDASSGRTDYTISMIVNISSATPAGHYSGDFAAIVVPTY